MEDAVHPLPRERPDGDAVAEHADDADDEDEQPLGRPLKFSKDPRSSLVLLKVIFDLLQIFSKSLNKFPAIDISRSLKPADADALLEAAAKFLLRDGGGVDRESGVALHVVTRRPCRTLRFTAWSS